MLREVLIIDYQDYVHVMCYDYHGKWDQKTGHNAPLQSRPTESGKDLTLNVEYTLAYLLKKGAKPEKTVLGVPLYGRAYTLVNPNSNKMGAPAKKTAFQVSLWWFQILLGICLQRSRICMHVGLPTTHIFMRIFQGPYTREDGFLGYNEICMEKLNQEAPWTQVWEEHHLAPFMYR